MLVVVASVLLLAAPIAWAVDNGGPTRYRVAGWIDIDGDGLISKEEFLTPVMEQFKILDLNGDGALSEKEFSARENAQFSALDKNGDGKLTKDELTFPQPSMPPEMKALMDRQRKETELLMKKLKTVKQTTKSK